MPAKGTARSAQTLAVFRAEHFRVVNGANLGDPVGHAEELELADMYRLSPVAGEVGLRVVPHPDRPFTVAPGTEVGAEGAELHLDCSLTLMSGDGATTEAIVLVETDAQGDVAATYLLPLAPITPKRDYALVGVDTEGPLASFAQMACVSFTRGTLITLATGAQCAVEDLRVGDKVLTRDDGPQPIRWIGQRTTRASGGFAPVEIRAGVLNNLNDLVVSPDHRLFIYQRRDELGAGRAEILVRARHLVNGDTVRQLSGGFVDYFQMLFDHHQIIYAEGIAAESMLVDERTAAILPSEFEGRLAELLPGHEESSRSGLEVAEELLRRGDAAALLRKSSSG
ncbi:MULTISPECIES: Hint domain-containing protein [unclassified Roseivivax]|uniref:Hint domain-containing protein n=1 Tax=Roseivivax sp. GX 12232 TaxID=2900547 RepID=UPI001E3BE1D2|nr:Hint domain-containing protein [Roseivivax sp. GX 12232]MCE0504248.1 Hint domain-containing protein [Roseivivax sp. GX 12232]